MASEEVLLYGDYEYDFDEFDQQIENILAKIVDCNYVLREDKNNNNYYYGTETRNQTINKEDTIKRVDRKSVCGIEHADFEAAVDYVQAGFQISWKISSSFNYLVLKAHL